MGFNGRPAPPGRGIFVAFEGVEGSGKSTQIDMLLELLQERRVPVTPVREPGGTKIGRQIRSLLLDPANREMFGETEALLYAASRAQLVRELIIPELERGFCVLSDRYVDSSLAYQSFGRGVDFDGVLGINELAIGGLWPDLTILLDVPPEVGLARATTHAADRIEMAGIAFHRRVREGFLELAERFKDRIVVIDGMRPIPEVHKDVAKLVLGLLD